MTFVRKICTFKVDEIDTFRLPISRFQPSRTIPVFDTSKILVSLLFLWIVKHLYHFYSHPLLLTSLCNFKINLFAFFSSKKSIRQKVDSVFMASLSRLIFHETFNVTYPSFSFSEIFILKFESIFFSKRQIFYEDILAKKKYRSRLSRTGVSNIGFAYQ